MSDSNKTYRIRARAGEDSNYLPVQLDQDYDILEILSMKIDWRGAFNLHTSNYGVVVGRVIANGGVGVPNSKISIFITKDEDDDSYVTETLYPYTSYQSKNSDGVRYNLLINTDGDVNPDNCHQVIGTFPSKKLVLDDDNYIEIFEKYYKFTTKTNDAGDYMIFGVPTGNHMLHMDLDISDCGILSQRPRDFVYKGYSIEQFENPNQFKINDELDSLSQVLTQNQGVDVKPFWGETGMTKEIGITRADINVNFKFETTCVFMGSVFTDDPNNGINKKCVPSKEMGKMSKLTTGRGNIEIIRKTPSGAVEELNIKGTDLIDGNGVWCFQIPMNLDYMMTDEYGNLVATDDPDKGIATRARVRFRISMGNESDSAKYFQAKVLVPNNPSTLLDGENSQKASYYSFGSSTAEEDFRDLFWNGVYSVKSYIPRIQYANRGGNTWRTQKFSGIKTCNAPVDNNPFPFNHIRLRFPFMYMVLCWLINAMILAINLVNKIITGLTDIIFLLNSVKIFNKQIFNIDNVFGNYLTVSDSLCPEMSGTYIAPGARNTEPTGKDWKKNAFKYLVTGTYAKILNDEYPQLAKNGTNVTATYPVTSYDNKGDDSSDGEVTESGKITTTQDTQSTAYKNGTTSSGGTVNLSSTASPKTYEKDPVEQICVTTATTYLMECVEMNLAEEYEVINFDFYNDWVNGCIYMPRWAREVRKKLFRKGNTVKACFNDTSSYKKTMKLTGLGMLSYEYGSFPVTAKGANNFNDKWNTTSIQINVFGKKGGLVNYVENQEHLKVYYFKPCEYVPYGDSNTKRLLLFATDIILLGHLNDCNIFSIPKMSTGMDSTSYKLPPDLVSTNLLSDGKEYQGSGCVDVTDAGKPETVYKAYKEGVASTINKSMIVTGQTENEELVSATEEAGISWVVTGPNQFTKSKDDLYSPGGHFLALACVPSKSSTNIKSIINASRMCEAGVTTSERIEIDFKKGAETETHYFVPTGLISKDEITDNSFRSKFATLNFNGLRTEIDPNTGYLRYNFKYLYPSNFDGSARRIVDGTSYEPSGESYIYTDLNGVVTSSTKTYRKGQKPYNLKLYGNSDIAYTSNIKNLDTEDTERAINKEITNTYTRTWEYLDSDYYCFRMGLNSLTSPNEKLRYHFVGNVTSSPLPQFENSYYFYFGLKDGNSAIDRLNESFFATCAPKADADYAGKMICTEVANGEYGDCSNRIALHSVVLQDVEPTYSISLREGESGMGKNYLDDEYKRLAYVTTLGDDNQYHPLFPPTSVTIQTMPSSRPTIYTYISGITDYNSETVFLYFSSKNGDVQEIEVSDNGKWFVYNSTGATISDKKYLNTLDSFSTTEFIVVIPNTDCTLTVASSQGFILKRQFTTELPISLNFVATDFNVKYETKTDTSLIPRFGVNRYGVANTNIGGYIETNFDITRAKAAMSEDPEYKDGLGIAIVNEKDNSFAYYGYYDGGDMPTGWRRKIKNLVLGTTTATDKTVTAQTTLDEMREYSYYPLWEYPETEDEPIRYYVYLCYDLKDCTLKSLIKQFDVYRTTPAEHNLVAYITGNTNGEVKTYVPVSGLTEFETVLTKMQAGEDIRSSIFSPGYLLNTAVTLSDNESINVNIRVVETDETEAYQFTTSKLEYDINTSSYSITDELSLETKNNFRIPVPTKQYQRIGNSLGDYKLVPMEYNGRNITPITVIANHTSSIYAHNALLKYVAVNEWEEEGYNSTNNTTSLCLTVNSASDLLTGNFVMLFDGKNKENKYLGTIAAIDGLDYSIVVSGNCSQFYQDNYPFAVYMMSEIPYISFPIKGGVYSVYTNLYNGHTKYASPSMQYVYSWFNEKKNLYNPTIEHSIQTSQRVASINMWSVKVNDAVLRSINPDNGEYLFARTDGFYVGKDSDSVAIADKDNFKVYYAEKDTPYTEQELFTGINLDNPESGIWEPMEINENTGDYELLAEKELCYILEVYEGNISGSTFKTGYVTLANQLPREQTTYYGKYSIDWFEQPNAQIEMIRREGWLENNEDTISARVTFERPEGCDKSLHWEGYFAWRCNPGSINVTFGTEETRFTCEMLPTEQTKTISIPTTVTYDGHNGETVNIFGEIDGVTLSSTEISDDSFLTDYACNSRANTFIEQEVNITYTEQYY